MSVYVTGVTYNGVAMTRVDDVGTANRWFNLWYLTAPATGAHDIVVSLSASSFCGLAAASYTGVSQTGQPEVELETAGASPLSLGLTTLTDNSWIIAGAKAETGNTAAGTGATLRGADNLGITAILDSGGAITPAGAATLEVTGTTAMGGISIAIAPAGAVATKAKPMFRRSTRFFTGR